MPRENPEWPVVPAETIRQKFHGRIDRVKRSVAGKLEEIADAAGAAPVAEKLHLIAHPEEKLMKKKLSRRGRRSQQVPIGVTYTSTRPSSAEARPRVQKLPSIKPATDRVAVLATQKQDAIVSRANELSSALSEGRRSVLQKGGAEARRQLTLRRKNRIEHGAADGDASTLADMLREADVGLLKCSYIRKLATRGEAPPPRQNLPPGSFMIVDHWTTLFRVGIYAVSHAWQTKEHPDPHGQQMICLAAELDTHGAADDDVVFYDWSSLYQAISVDGMPGFRTPIEATYFKKAIKGMEMLYSHDRVMVVVLPQVFVRSDQELCEATYWDRGWCFMELSVASHFGKIINVSNMQVNELVGLAPNEPEDILSMLRTKSFTVPADKKEVIDIVERVFELGLDGSLRGAAESGDAYKVREFLSKGANVNGQDPHGRTALHRLAMTATEYISADPLSMFADCNGSSRADVVRMLLGARADPTLRAVSGHTALEVARVCGQVEVAAALKSGMKSSF